MDMGTTPARLMILVCYRDVKKGRIVDTVKDLLELAKYHAKRHNARRNQVETGLDHIPERTIVVPEDSGPGFS